MAAATELAQFAASLTLNDIPAEVQETATLHLLDAFGAGLAGLAMGEMQSARDIAEEMGGRPEATAMGISDKLPPGVAAFANAAVIHALDFDDTHDAALVHSSAVIGPVALACGEAWTVDGRDLVAAIVAGFEISSRIGLAGAGNLHVRGFHPTSVCGVFAAAAIASRLRGLDATGTTNALGIAGSFSSGILEFLADGSQTKPYHPGWASLGGITAAGLAARGGTGPATVLEGRFGLLPTHLNEGQYDLAALTAGLGSRWETSAIAIKPYPACHCTHTVLDALRVIIDTTSIGPDDVASIVCLVPSEVAVRLVLEPSDRKKRPSNPYDAKFSLPFTVGAMLVHDFVGVESFTDQAIADPRVLAVAERVEYEVRPFESGNADLAGAITVRTIDGREFTHQVLVPRGGSDNPMTADQIRAKFELNASLALSESDVDALITAFDKLATGGAAPIAAVLARTRL